MKIKRAGTILFLAALSAMNVRLDYCNLFNLHNVAKQSRNMIRCNAFKFTCASFNVATLLCYYFVEGVSLQSPVCLHKVPNDRKLTGNGDLLNAAENIPV